MSLSLKKKLCTLSTVCILSFSPVFAEEEYTAEILEGFVQQSKMTDLTPEYISGVESLFNQQINNAKFETAEKTANYLVDITKKYYGKHNIKTAEAYTARARLYRKYIMPDKATKDLKSAEALFKWIAKDNQLKYSVEGDFADLYSSLAQPYDSIEHFNKLHPNKNSDLNIASISYQMIAGYYNQAGDIINTRKNLEKAIEKYNKMQNPNKYALMNVYSALADISSPKESWKYVEEQTNIANTMPENEFGPKIDAKIKQLQYYDRMDLLTQHKKLLDEAASMVAKHKNPDWEISMAWLYISYYKSVDNQSMVKKYVDILKKYQTNEDFSGLPENSLILARKYEFDINSSFDDLDKAQKEVDKALKLTEPVKKYAPVWHAKFLMQGARVNIQKRDFKTAKGYIDEAQNILKKMDNTPENQILALYNVYYDYYIQQNDLNNALEYQNKMIDKMTQLMGNSNPDVIGHKLDRAKLYLQLGNKQMASTEIDEIINDKKKAYGDNHVKVYELMFSAAYMFGELDKDKTDELNAKIKTAVESGNLVGTAPELYYSVYIAEAFKAKEQNNLQTAAKYGEKAVKYARHSGQKLEVYYLLADVYSKISGKKALSQKYKKLISTVKF